MAQWRRLLGSQKWQRPGGGGGGGERLLFAGARPISDGGGGGGEEREAAGEERNTGAAGRREGGGTCEKQKRSWQRHNDRPIQHKRSDQPKEKTGCGHFYT